MFNPVVGQSIILTAQIYPQIAAGNVTFYDEGNEIGKAQITNGKANLTTSFSSASNHAIKAMYSGDANFLKSETTIKLEVLAPGYEADVTPRANGDGKVTIADWVQIGRFATGLEKPNDGNEFQRADCAPKNTKGDGAISVADWVQAGRYAAGFDPIVTVGGLTTALLTSNSPLVTEGGKFAAETTGNRKLTTITDSKEPGVLLVQLDAQGNENALSFSLSFNPSIVRYSSATFEGDAQGAQLIINQLQAQAGRVGIALALPAGKTFQPKATTLLRLKFDPIGRDFPNSTEVRFSDDLIRRSLVDAFANNIPASYTENALILRRGPTTRRDTAPRKTSIK